MALADIPIDKSHGEDHTRIQRPGNFPYMAKPANLFPGRGFCTTYQQTPRYYYCLNSTTGIASSSKLSPGLQIFS